MRGACFEVLAGADATCNSSLITSYIAVEVGRSVYSVSSTSSNKLNARWAPFKALLLHGSVILPRMWSVWRTNSVG